MRLLPVISTILAIVSCSPTNTNWIRGDESTYVEFRNSEVPSALDRFEAVWVKNNYMQYSYEIRRGGVFGGSIYRITVSDKGCNAKYVRHIGLRSEFGCKSATMPQLFADLREALSKKNELVAANFDPYSGALISFYVEPLTDFTDQGWGMNIEKFKTRGF